MKIVSLALICILLYSCGGSEVATDSSVQSASEEEQMPEKITISAAALGKAYEDNEVAADEIYKGKKLIVSGKIDDIGKDLMDDAYVTLSIGKEMSIVSIQCYFSDSKVVATLKKGRSITVEGECNGLMMNVQLKDCVLK